LARQLSATAARFSVPQEGKTREERAKDMWDPERFDNHFINYFNRIDIDGWEIRKAMTELHHCDVVPDPQVIIAALRACRRINEYSLAVRFLEAVKFKCGPAKNQKILYPWIINEIRPVLEELGITTPEELGYDKPEFFVPDPAIWWEKRWYKDYGIDQLEGYRHFAEK